MYNMVGLQQTGLLEILPMIRDMFPADVIQLYNTRIVENHNANFPKGILYYNQHTESVPTHLRPTYTVDEIFTHTYMLGTGAYPMFTFDAMFWALANLPKFNASNVSRDLNNLTGFISTAITNALSHANWDKALEDAGKISARCIELGQKYSTRNVEEPQPVVRSSSHRSMRDLYGTTYDYLGVDEVSTSPFERARTDELLRRYIAPTRRSHSLSLDELTEEGSSSTEPRLRPGVTGQADLNEANRQREAAQARARDLLRGRNNI